jgi:hypothetical protein
MEHNISSFLGCGADGLLKFLGYLQTTQNDSVSTAYRHLSAVAFNYRLKGLTSPSEDIRVTMFMKGLKRKHQGKSYERLKILLLNQ